MNEEKTDLINTAEEFILRTYTRSPLVVVKAEGMRVKDVNGEWYLDFFSGWGVHGVGFCNRYVVDAIKNQVQEVIHIPNNYYTIPQVKLAERIIQNSFPGKVFFCNSGAEAVETAIKLAKKYGKGKRYEVLSMESSFHGRTLAAVTATGQAKYHNPFSPLPVGFKYIKFNDITAVKNTLREETVAVLLELVQGEGGVNVADKDFVCDLRRLCTEKDLVLIFDEVQTGMGRCGKLFALQQYGIIPDVMTLAKALGAGVPIGAVVVSTKFEDILTPGTHASTFGGNALACAAALGVFEAIDKEKMLENVAEKSPYLFGKLKYLWDKYPDIIKDVRGLGLMFGIELNCDGFKIIKNCFNRKLLLNCTQGCILRIMPALNVSCEQIDEAIGVLDDVFSKL